MYRRWQFWIGIPALALATLLLTTTTASAQRRGGGRGWGNSNITNFGNSGLGLSYYPGYGLNVDNWNRGYYNQGYYGNQGYFGYGQGYYLNSYYGNNWNRGYYAPSYYNQGWYSYGDTQPYYQQQDYSSFYPAEEMPPNAAMVHVRVPARAELWFGGDKTVQTGNERDFVTPELKQDKDYFYTLKARWMSDEGKAVERTKRVKVRANSHVMVDFSQADAVEERDLRNDRRDEPREDRRELQPAPDRVKPPADRTPAKPIPNPPRSPEVVP